MATREGRTIATFGEIMLRLSPPGRELLLQTPRFDVWTAGAEANVAVALARLGHPVSMVSAVPNSPLGDSAVATMRSHGVDCKNILRTPGRMGLYFVESGAGLRATEILYDRGGSSFATIPAEAWDWENLLVGVNRLHLSGITAALGPNGTKAALAATETAADLGIPISFDCNYRSKLWESWDSNPRDTLHALVERADILFGNHRDVTLLLGRAFAGEGSARRREAALAAFEAFPRLMIIASTARTLDNVDHHIISSRVDTREEGIEMDPQAVPGIVDRVGTGDAFAAGVLDAVLSDRSPHDMARTGLALSLFKHSVPGDATLIDRWRLEQILSGSFDARR